LRDSEVLTKDQAGRYDLDEDVVKKLKDEGFLKKKGPQVQAICGGHTKW
jgi:hypothetical protein